MARRLQRRGWPVAQIIHDITGVHTLCKPCKRTSCRIQKILAVRSGPFLRGEESGWYRLADRHWSAGIRPPSGEQRDTVPTRNHALCKQFHQLDRGDNGTRGANSPLYTYSDTLSWTKGKHAFKAGGEVRIGHSNGWNDSNFTPQATLGAGGVPVANLDSVAVPGLSANSQTTARNLLTDLSGSVASIQEGFDVRSPTDTTFRGYADGVNLKLRDYHGNEFSGFLKDTWKIRPALTLNLGIHYDWFGVPYEGKGLAGKPVGAETGLCGISCGTLTTVQFVGKNSPNPGQQLFNDDWNNLAPSIGLSWSLPWFGKDKTVVRAGYGWSYTGGLKTIGDISAIAQLTGTFEGSGTTGISYTSPSYLSLANLKLPIPQQFAPLQPDPLNGSRADSMAGASTNRPSPYVQNVNFEVQRQLPQGFTLTTAYVGTKGTRLWAEFPKTPWTSSATTSSARSIPRRPEATRPCLIRCSRDSISPELES